jgi:hypothetical protein
MKTGMEHSCRPAKPWRQGVVCCVLVLAACPHDLAAGPSSEKPALFLGSLDVNGGLRQRFELGVLAGSPEFTLSVFWDGTTTPKIFAYCVSASGAAGALPTATKTTATPNPSSPPMTRAKPSPTATTSGVPMACWTSAPSLAFTNKTATTPSAALRKSSRRSRMKLSPHRRPVVQCLSLNTDKNIPKEFGHTV